MISVRDLLQVKGEAIWWVSPHTPLLACLKELADKDVGALLVLQESKLVGIVSERDIVRSLAQSGDCVRDATVADFMTKDLITVTPKTYIVECMQLMTKHHIRHLPVLEEGKLLGIISIGDVVNGVINGQEITITSLQNYIEGTGYGR